MSINYASYTQQIANLLVFTSTETVFQTMLPGMIDYAEQRLYRELDLLATRVTDNSASTTVGGGTLALPTTIGTFLVVEQVNIVTATTRVPLVYTSLDFVDLVSQPSATYLGVPEFYTMRDNATIQFSPTPDAVYSVSIRGTQRPTPLSSGNSSTILTQMLPDCMIAASMVFGTGFQRDFGAQTDNPQSPIAWESQYSKLMQSANVEELRKKYQSQAWTNQIPNPVVQPPRV